MAAPKLKDFKKSEPLQGNVVRSVNFKRDHIEFLEKNNLNASALIRSLLDEYISKNKKGE